MKKLNFCIFALSAMLLSSSAFAQDTIKHSSKDSKKITRKVTKYHKSVKKTVPSV